MEILFWVKNFKFIHIFTDQMKIFVFVCDSKCAIIFLLGFRIINDEILNL